MAKKITMTGEEFSRLVRVLREFKTPQTDCTASAACDMFYFDVAQTAKGLMVTGYASDGHRAVAYDAPATGDANFGGYFRNPTFTPKSTDEVTLELRGKNVYLTYRSYNVTFGSPQPDDKKHVITLKKALADAESRPDDREVTLNSRYVAGAMKAASAAGNGETRVKFSVGKSLMPVSIKDNSGRMRAVVLPIRV